MQRLFVLVGILCLTSLLSWPQAAPAAKTAPASGAKPAAAPRPSGPTAVIDTTVGKLKCELFPNVAPIGVAN